MSTATESMRAVPAKVSVWAVAAVDSSIVAATAIWGPNRALLGIIACAVFLLLASSPVGLVLWLALTSHICDVPGVDFSALRLLKWVTAIALLWVLIVRMLKERSEPSFQIGGLEKAFLAFMLWTMFCSLFAVRPVASMVEALRYGTLLLVYLVARHTITSTRRVRLLLGAILATVLLSSMYSFSGLLGAQYQRFSGFLAEATGFGGLLYFCLPALLVGFQVHRRFAVRMFYAVGLAAGLVALILSWSRGAWGAIFVFAVAYLILEKKRKLVCILVGLSVLLALLLVFSEGAYSDFYRLARLSAGTTRRVVYWQAGIEMAAESPILGHGFALTRQDVRNEVPMTSVPQIIAFRQGEIGYNPHNMYIGLVVDNGIPALILMLLVYYFMFKGQAVARKAAVREDHRILHSTMIAVLIGNLFHSFFEGGPLFAAGSTANYFWLMLGMAAAVREKDLAL